MQHQFQLRPGRASGQSLRSASWPLGLGVVTIVAALGTPVAALAGGGTEQQTYGAYDRGSYTKAVYQDSHTSYLSDPDSTYFTAGRSDNTVHSDPLRTLIRNFFVFDLLPTDATVIKAELVLKFNGAAFDSEDDSETFALYDVSSDLDALVAGGDGTARLDAIWDDLGSGHKYASRTFTAADQGKVIRIPLDATARLQAALGGKLAIGGAITTLSSKPAGNDDRFWDQLLFTFSGGDFVSLDLTYAGSQPDGWLKSGTGSGVGYGVVNHTAAGQTLTRSAATGKTVTWTLTIWNAGGLTDRYKIIAAGSANGYKVRYLWDGKDITNAVAAETYRTPQIDMATSGDLTIKVTVTAKAKAGSSLARTITVQSVGDHRSDVVKAITKRR